MPCGDTLLTAAARTQTVLDWINTSYMSTALRSTVAALGWYE